MSEENIKPNPAPAPAPTIERSTDFHSYYANNILFESTAWDMKLTFGHIDNASVTPLLIKNDCSVTIPWPQAKLALFWLRLHVEGAEAEVGVKIPIRKDLLPGELPEHLPGLAQENDPRVKMFREIYNKLRAEFLKTL